MSSQKHLARNRHMAELYAKGLTLAEVGASVGITAAGVCLALKRSGVATRSVGAPKGFRSLSRADEIAALYKSGLTQQEVGERFGVSRQYIEQVLRKLGVSRDFGGASVRVLLSLDKLRAKRDACDVRLFRLYGIARAEYDSIIARYGKATARTSPIIKFREQKNSAKYRGIAWELTFKEWWTIWEGSGRWEQRGPGTGYCMARLGDSGPYSAGNVEIITIGQNFSDSYLVKPWVERFADTHAVPRTHCKHGHAFSPENTAHYKSVNGRVCKTCAAIRSKKYYGDRHQAESMVA